MGVLEQACVYRRAQQVVGSGTRVVFLGSMLFPPQNTPPKHPPQAGDKYYNTPTGKQLDRIRYMTQVATRPPGFAVFMNGNDAPDGAFVRFLKSSLQQHFHFEGTPVRLSFRMKDGSRVRI